MMYRSRYHTDDAANIDQALVAKLFPELVFANRYTILATPNPKVSCKFCHGPVSESAVISIG
jgi:hypothetical protein